MSKFSGLRGLKTSATATAEQSGISATQNAGLSEPRKLGRPRAKRSDPDYTQVTAYIRKDTYLAVKRKLLDLGAVEFSDTLQELLEDWLKVGNMSI